MTRSRARTPKEPYEDSVSYANDDPLIRLSLGTSKASVRWLRLTTGVLADGSSLHSSWERPMSMAMTERLNFVRVAGNTPIVPSYLSKAFVLMGGMPHGAQISHYQTQCIDSVNADYTM